MKALLAKAKQSVQVAMFDLKETVASHVGDLLGDIYDAGNPFVAKRAAMACMQHAQTVIAALANLPEFKALLPATDDPCGLNLFHQIRRFSRVLNPRHRDSGGNRRH